MTIPLIILKRREAQPIYNLPTDSVKYTIYTQNPQGLKSYIIPSIKNCKYPIYSLPCR